MQHLVAAELAQGIGQCRILVAPLAIQGNLQPDEVLQRDLFFTITRLGSSSQIGGDTVRGGFAFLQLELGLGPPAAVAQIAEHLHPAHLHARAKAAAFAQHALPVYPSHAVNPGRAFQGSLYQACAYAFQAFFRAQACDGLGQRRRSAHSQCQPSESVFHGHGLRKY